jgi:hypothetical protein
MLVLPGRRRLRPATRSIATVHVALNVSTNQVLEPTAGPGGISLPGLFFVRRIRL